MLLGQLGIKAKHRLGVSASLRLLPRESSIVIMSQPTQVALSTLKAGDIIYADVHIDVQDMADPNAKSTTAKKYVVLALPLCHFHFLTVIFCRIRKGDPVTRLCIVLTPGAHSVDVTYQATFAQSTSLPGNFTDKDLWYPVSPAKKEGSHEPLPALGDGKAAWASLRKTQTITQDPVEYSYLCSHAARSLTTYIVIFTCLQVKIISGLKYSEHDAGLIKAAMKA